MTRAMLFVFLPLLGAAADVTGSWNLKLIRFGEEFAAARVELKVDGSKLTGTLNELKLDGTFQNDTVTFVATRPNGDEFGKLEGRVQGDEITGTVKQGDDEFIWKASRAKAVEPPQTRTFEPVKFYRVFS